MDEFESNHSEIDSDAQRKAEKVSDSDWESRLGATEKGGYNMAAIRWTDLGRKYIIKKGRKSVLPDLDDSYIGKSRNAAFHTIDDRFADVGTKAHLDLDRLAEKQMGRSLSLSGLRLRHQSVEH